jgi:hypothetical protein
MPFDALTSFWSSLKALGEGAAAIPTMERSSRRSPLGFRSRAADGEPREVADRVPSPGNPERKRSEWIQKRKNPKAPGEPPTGDQQRQIFRHRLEEFHNHPPMQNRWNKAPSMRTNW